MPPKGDAPPVPKQLSVEVVDQLVLKRNNCDIHILQQVSKRLPANLSIQRIGRFKRHGPGNDPTIALAKFDLAATSIPNLNRPTWVKPVLTSVAIVAAVSVLAVGIATMAGVTLPVVGGLGISGLFGTAALEGVAGFLLLPQMGGMISAFSIVAGFLGKEVVNAIVTAKPAQPAKGAGLLDQLKGKVGSPAGIAGLVAGLLGGYFGATLLAGFGGAALAGPLLAVGLLTYGGAALINKTLLKDSSPRIKAIVAVAAMGVGIAAVIGLPTVALALGTVGGAVAGIALPLLIALVAAPMALSVYRGIRAHYGDPYTLMASMGKNVQVHLITGLLLFAGYLITLGAEAWMDSPPAILT